MKTTRIILLSMVAAAAVSCNCGNSARISLQMADAPSSELVIKAQDINRYTVLDTLATDENGKLEYKVKVQKGDPEFFYIYWKNSRVASMLLEAGDKVSITADTLGNYKIEGSETSMKMAEVLAEQKRTDAKIAAVLDRFSEDNLPELRKEFNQIYISYYRRSLKYAMDNSKSLVVIPVLYQKLQKDVPVFGNLNDALIFRTLCDSLKTVYPESRYVKALEAEAQSRVGNMELSHRISSTEPVGFPDLALKDKNLQEVKLSEVEGKCIILHFWNPSDPAQKMINKDILMPLYKEYHKKGLEIYEVAITPDRTGWGLAVEEQKLPWINVCDVSVDRSAAAVLYNLKSLPTTFFISEGVLVDESPANLPAIRKLMDRLLK